MIWLAGSAASAPGVTEAADASVRTASAPTDICCEWAIDAGVRISSSLSRDRRQSLEMFVHCHCGFTV